MAVVKIVPICISLEIILSTIVDILLITYIRSTETKCKLIGSDGRWSARHAITSVTLTSVETHSCQQMEALGKLIEMI